jgi:hypothetical protein
MSKKLSNFTNNKIKNTAVIKGGKGTTPSLDGGPTRIEVNPEVLINN